MKQCTFLFEGKKFGSEEELEDYLRKNHDSLIAGAEDYRFSKEIQEDNIRRIDAEWDKNKAAVKAVMQSRYDNEEHEDVYGEGTMGVLEFIKTQGVTNRSEQFNLDNWERHFRAQLENEYRQLPEEGRKAAIDARVQAKKDEFDQTRRVGKGIHMIADDVFSGGYIDYDAYPALIRAKVNARGNGEFDLSPLTDKAIKDIVMALQKVKKEMFKTRRYKKIFFEPCIGFEDDNYKIKGRMDMVVVYDDDTIDIVDFKVSSTSYDAWDDDKKNTALAQLMTYQAMLENLGVKPDEFNLKVVPVKLARSEGKFTGASASVVALSPDYSVRYKLYGLLNINMAAKPLTAPLAEGAMKALSGMFGFDVFNAGYDEKSFKHAFDTLVSVKNGVYELKMLPGMTNGDRRITRTSRAEMEDDLRRHLAALRDKRKNDTARIARAFADLTEGGNADIPLTDDKNVNSWLNINLTKYKINPNWKIVQNDDLNALGVLMFKNDADRTVDFVSVMYEDIVLPLDLGKGKTLLGYHFGDGTASASRLEANMGNIELVKLMYIANQLVEGYNTEELKVLSLSTNKVMDDSVIREKLETNYDILANAAGLPRNNIRARELYGRVASIYNAVMNSKPIANYFRTNSINPEHFKNDELTRQATDRMTQLGILKKLRDDLIEHYYRGRRNATEDQSVLGYLFAQVEGAIAKMQGFAVDFINEDRLTENLVGGESIMKAAREKKLFNSIPLQTVDTIPIITAIYDRIIEGNTAVRKKYIAYKVNDRKHTDKFKNGRKGLRNNRFVNNPEVVFRNLIDRSDRKDLRFKDYRTDTSLSSDEKEYLKWYLDDLNAMRFGTTDIGEISEQGKDWLQVPLVKAKMLSQVINNKQGVRKALRDQLGLDDTVIDPKMAMGLNPYQTEFGRNGLIFEGIYNSFAASSDDNMRRAMIEENGLEAFETNLERIKDLYAYTMMKKETLDPVIADASSALCSYAWLAKINGEDMFKANKPTIDYMVNFIKSSVLDMSLFDEKEKEIWRGVSAVKSVASKMVLGLNVMSMMKEGLVGWWTLFNNANANKWDDSRFGMKEAAQAYAMVWRDGFRQIKTITMGEHLNAEYGISSMSEQEIVDRMNYYQGQFGRINNYLFFTARSPDFLHRMTVFFAYMLKDGNYDAHKLVDGHIEYDWRKDGRFKVYAKYKGMDEGMIPKADLETFRDQRALYETIREQMVWEGAVVTDWKTGKTRPMTIDDEDIPRAYTVMEAQKMIQEANTMYGYMDSTNKSMFFRKGIGVVIGQFQAYLTAKKTQYFVSPGAYKTGKWVDKKDPVTGKRLYRKLLENGRYEETTEDTGMPVKEWQGGMMEGIFWSLASLFNAVKFFDGRRDEVLKAWKDPVKRRNLDLFIGDMAGLWGLLLVCYLLFGDVPEKDKTCLDKDLQVLLRNSSAEFNIFALFTQPLELHFVAWDVLVGFTESMKAALFGTSNLPRAIGGNIGALRPFKPLIYDMFPLEQQD